MCVNVVVGGELGSGDMRSLGMAEEGGGGQRACVRVNVAACFPDGCKEEPHLCLINVNRGGRRNTHTQTLGGDGRDLQPAASKRALTILHPFSHLYCSSSTGAASPPPKKTV